MTTRLHRDDLRALMAAIMSTDANNYNVITWHEKVTKHTDLLLAELDRTAPTEPEPEPEPQPWPKSALERLDWWAGKCAEWETLARAAQQERDAAIARAEVAELRADKEAFLGWQAADRTKETESRLERLRPYVGHKEYCLAQYQAGDECTCGLDAAMGE